MSLEQYENLFSTIRNRRSIYPHQYINREIDDETISRILEVARWAPNHKITEPWRFKVIKGDALQRLGTYLGNTYKNTVPEEKFSELKYRKNVEKPTKAAAVIAISMVRDPLNTVPEWEEIAATACAVQNMWLAASSLNIGAYWSTPKIFLENNTFIPLEEGERILGLFYMGYYLGMIPDREPGLIEEKTIWIRR